MRPLKKIVTIVFLLPTCGQYSGIVRAIAQFREAGPEFSYTHATQHIRGRVLAYSASGIVLKSENGIVQPMLIGTILRSAPHGDFNAPFENYTIADLKNGDSVVIGYITLNRVDYAETLCIRRRPGGRVPIAPGEVPTSQNQWHERCNAEQELEEKGIPLPEKFTRFNGFGKWNGVPVLGEWMDKNQRPTARPIMPSGVVQ